ncbi:MAG: type I-A CRISPR-associated protein Cas5a [Thermofilaceae archaeon]
MVKVVAARIRLPLFSITQPEAFQVLVSLPIPQPATLVGALAYAYGVHTGKGIRAYHELLEFAERGELLAARARIADSPTSGAAVLIPSSVVLRRFRVADKAHETKKKGERRPIHVLYDHLASGDYASAKRVLEVTLTDAFYREYVMGHELLAVWAFKSDVIEEAFWYINRLGDTESLCTVVDVQVTEGDVSRAREVETCFPAPLTPGARLLNGNFTVVKANDERRALKTFVIPMRATIETRRGRRYRILRSSTVRILYEREVDVCNTPWGTIVVG